METGRGSKFSQLSIFAIRKRNHWKAQIYHWGEIKKPIKVIKDTYEKSMFDKCHKGTVKGKVMNHLK